MKRLIDITGALVGLVLFLPLLAIVMLLVWWHDGHSPVYWALRVGKDGKLFRMAKLRSMVWGADGSGVDSTSADDARITRIGHVIRRYKLDELTQLWNVLIGDMSLVGPRPNVARETNMYTARERILLQVRPGITDFSSLVFADLSEILRGSSNPDIDYNQLVRPRKGLLGIFYVQHHSLWMDLQLIGLTVLGLFSRSAALVGIRHVLARAGAETDSLDAANRDHPLTPIPPPGAQHIVVTRGGASD